MDRIHLALSWYNSSTKATQWPHFGAMYFSLTDVEGHAHGPNSAAMNNSIQEIDQGLGYLLDHLDPRVNVLIVSDHGMTTLDPKQILYLDDFISASRFKMVDFSPIVSLRPILESGNTCYGFNRFIFTRSNCRSGSAASRFGEREFQQAIQSVSPWNHPWTMALSQ